MTIETTIAERGARYGDFTEQARITQNIKRAMRDSPNWERLPDDMKEALEMDAHKIARILNGDPDYHDSWHDVIGYTKLVADRLEKEQSGETGVEVHYDNTTIKNDRQLREELQKLMSGPPRVLRVKDTLE